MIAVCIQSEGILVQSPRSRFKQKSRTWIQIQVFDIETKLLMIFYELTLLAMGLWYVCEAMVYCISFNRCIIKKEQWCQTLTISWWKHRGSHQTSWRNRYGRYRCFWTSSTTFFGDLSTKIFWRNRNGHNLLSHLPIVWWAKASLCFAFSCELSENRSPWRAAGSRPGSQGYGAVCTLQHITIEDLVPTCLRSR